ncbi:macrolide ABC transporter permease [Lysinibacillus sp. BF-4]|uniref:ABC transporter permease n=1 Tax=Lysinibacillus sp. BF-4 TaxID=1473546 RepID=UPI000504AF8E|nr:FtsX-like permease family protein [Lysinibacillus sp. BF-4]KFL43550.1 macrolide ABC transporter permease [Lysinibacillus sp. BF-4]
MLLKDQLDFVKQHIVKNKMRVFMTILAATIGCAFLIVLASVGFGLQQTVKNEILSDEAVTRIQLYDDSLTKERAASLKDEDNVKAVVQKTQLPMALKSELDDHEAHSEGKFYDMTAFQKVNGKLAQGSYPKAADEIVVGYHYAQRLMNEADQEAYNEKVEAANKKQENYMGEDEGFKGAIVGQTVALTVENDEEQQVVKPFKIVGVLQAPSYEWMIDNQVIFSDKAINFFAGLQPDPFPSEYIIHMDSMENVKPLLTKLKKEGLGVYSVIEQMDQINVFFAVFKAGLLFVGTIAVLIASIGIFNTMTMAVTERTREIGVLKAIGASPKLIQRLFLMESAFIGIVGTVIAVIISYVISVTVNFALPIVLEMATGEDMGEREMIFSAIPWQLVVIASAISIGVAMISGWRPARKATKIDVIQALRQEV